MVRREIKNFQLVYGGESYACSVPFSVKSVLSAAGIECDELSGVACFESDIYVDDAALAMRNFYLRVRGINTPAAVYVEDKLIGKIDGKTPIYNFDASGILRKGNNRLSIRFDSSDCDLNYAGLCETVEILRFSAAIIDRVLMTQKHEDGSVKLDISLDFIGDKSSVRAVATLVSSSGQIYYAGLTKGQGSIEIKDPLFWWPRGLGVQNLYRLSISLYGEIDIEDNVEIRLGLRTAAIGDGGNLVINGVSTLLMGAVYIPDGNPDITVANDKATASVSSAAMANYNCLIIPLGAPKPTEKFYDLCDVHGIMVVEEHSTLDDGVISSLHHRSNHPSLCLIDLIGKDTKPAEVESLSAILPNMSLRVLENQPEYFGLPSLPSMKTIRSVVPEGERSLFSHSVEAMAEEGAIRNMLMSVADRYPYPADLSAFAYASALASAHKVGEVIKNSRLSLGQSGRGVFYRLNDKDLSISASAIDCRGRWKPIQYYSVRHFAPVTLYADMVDGVVTFRASSQRRLDLIGSLEYRIADASNHTIYTESVEVEIGAMTSPTLHTVNIGDMIKGREREFYLEYLIREGSYVVSRETMLFVPEKHFMFKKPSLKVVITGQDRRFSITIASDVFVKDLELSFDGVDAVFENNYLDLTSDAPVKVNFTITGGIETSFHLKDVLELRSVADLK
ncbi:MAG: hypothetical protein IKW53_02860 [Clostridia bacterium]|nr:hypothetical protein [Clostridia bacterium]